MEQEHNKWVWRDLWQDLQSKLNGSVKAYCLFSEGIIHAMMIVGPNMVSNLEKGKDLMYIQYLAVAPWNEHRMYVSHTSMLSHFRDDNIKAISGSGFILFRLAVALSKELGFGGRIGLHALDDAVEFYLRRCCMNFLGQNVHPEQRNPNYPWCELSDAGVRTLFS